VTPGGPFAPAFVVAAAQADGAAAPGDPWPEGAPAPPPATLTLTFVKVTDPVETMP
jgi:hypothetical protein